MEAGLLVTDSPPAMPERPLDIFLIAIGGTGMAPLACLLDELGHRVRGCDAPLYPPMSDLLAAAGIVPLVGYDPAHLDPAPDLVVVGNAVPRHNPVTAAAVERGLEQISMPQALARFFLAGRKPLVAAGTHGKTTTSSLAAWVYTACGADPGYLIGGVPLDLGRSFHAGAGERFVIEGDEYNAAWFDRGPKFLHYRPETAILTSVEYDHADLYKRPEDLLAAYRRLTEIVPAEGHLIACGDSAEVRRVAAGAGCPVTFYGLDPGNDLAPAALEPRAGGTLMTLDDPDAGRLEIRLPMAGRHNAVNALAVWAAARRDGLPAGDVAAALERFRGVRRRQEERRHRPRDHRGRRLRPPSHRGARDPDRPRPALPRPEAHGSLRATQPDRRPQPVPRRLPRGVRGRRPRAAGAALSPRPPGAGGAARPRRPHRRADRRRHPGRGGRRPRRAARPAEPARCGPATWWSPCPRASSAACRGGCSTASIAAADAKSGLYRGGAAAARVVLRSRKLRGFRPPTPSRP